MIKDYDIYLFDFDGTLVDSQESLEAIFSGAYDAVGVKVPDGYTKRLMRIPLEVGYEELKAPLDKTHIFGEKILSLLDDEEIAKLTKSFSDTIPTLLSLKERKKILGIVTSNNVKHTKLVLSLLGIDENLFSVIIGNDSCKKHKPNPDPILKALENVKEGKACYVGDALDDAKAAINANIDAILLDRNKEYSDYNNTKIYTLKNLL